MISTVLFYIGPIILGVIVLTTGIADIVFAMRAKRRLKQAIAVDLASNPDLVRLAQHAKDGLEDSEINLATDIISQALPGLTVDDRRLVERGLHQESESGEKRFVSDLMMLL